MNLLRPTLVALLLIAPRVARADAPRCTVAADNPPLQGDETPAELRPGRFVPELTLAAVTPHRANSSESVFTQEMNIGGHQLVIFGESGDAATAVILEKVSGGYCILNAFDSYAGGDGTSLELASWWHSKDSKLAAMLFRTVFQEHVGSASQSPDPPEQDPAWIILATDGRRVWTAGIAGDDNDDLAFKPSHGLLYLVETDAQGHVSREVLDASGKFVEPGSNSKAKTR